MKRSIQSNFRVPGWAALLLVLGLSLPLASCARLTGIPAKRLALSIGIQNYPGDMNDLVASRADAISMRNLLSSQGWTASSLLDSAATKDAIRDEISAMGAAADADSTVLVFYSGHGDISPDKQDTYLVTYDSLLSYPYSQEAMVSSSEMAEWLAALPVANVILIIDACNSGGFVQPGDSVDAIPQDYAGHGSVTPTFFATALSNFGGKIERGLSAPGSPSPVVISAAGSLEPSYEPMGGHGVFTHWLLKSAESGDSNHDGWVSCAEAYAYSAKGVQESWNEETWSDFMPHMSGGMRDLALFQAP